jgi:hypothetical protein
VIAVLLLLGLFWGPFTITWVRVTLPQIRARRHARAYMPPTTRHVVYDDDPQTYPQLLAGGAGGGYISRCWVLGGSGSAGRFAAYDNPVFHELIQTQTGQTFTVPAAFLHERTSPAGHLRIVVVQMSTWNNDTLNRFFFSSSAFDAPPVLPPARPLLSPMLVMYRTPGAALRVYDGAIDPNDRSRFTFAVEHNGKRLIVHGQLLDTEQVTLEPEVGLLADFRQEHSWIPPGASVPKDYEPSCYIDLATATTRPRQYLGSTRRGFRDRINEKGMLVHEDLKHGTTQTTTAPAGMPF